MLLPWHRSCSSSSKRRPPCLPRLLCAATFAFATRAGTVHRIFPLFKFVVSTWDMIEHELFLSTVLYTITCVQPFDFSPPYIILSLSLALFEYLYSDSVSVSRSCSRCRRSFAPPISLPSASRSCARSASGAINRQLRDMIQTLASTQYSTIANS